LRTELIVIRSAGTDDAEAITRIYNHYVRETIVTFEEEPVSSAEMINRMTEVANASLPWIVAEHDGAVVGHAYASKWKGRCAYRYSVETTIYLAPHCVNKGIGTQLYRQLLAHLRDAELHIAIGGVALPNAASVALHEKLGFRKVAHFAEVGFKFGKWIDVAYWQLPL
jgi:L-amino acid N-acyltransferase YncA